MLLKYAKTAKHIWIIFDIEVVYTLLETLALVIIPKKNNGFYSKLQYIE